jgi:two-component sensor histidine kinase
MASFREGSLGYGLVRSLVEQINGNIAVQSDPGLTVTISFPAPPMLSEADNEAEPRGAPAHSALR